MHNFDLISTLALGLVGALLCGYATNRLGWSPIVGYLLAGIAVGPHTPGFVANRDMAEQLAEIGVVLLMFGVGLHFHLKDLLAVRGIAVTGAVVQSIVATGLGALVSHTFGWSWSSGLVFGAALSIASTVVLIRVLADHGELHSPAGRVAVGWLVVEDIFTVFLLVLLPAVYAAPAQSGGTSVPAAMGMAAVKLGGFIALILLGGRRAVPWLLNKVADTRSRELFTLSVLALALGIAAGAAYVFDVSMALGAFLAGMVVGQSDFSARAGAEALPLRDAFAVMFFLSIGLLFDPRQALASWALILATLGVILVGKPLAALGIVAALGYGSRIGLAVALALAQIGEFSFLLATLGRRLGALSEDAMNALVAAAVVSITLNPLLYKAGPRIEAYLVRHPRLWSVLNRKSAHARGAPEDGDTVRPAYRAVIVGYGPIGQTVSRILRQRGIEPTVIEMNIETHRRLRIEGQRVVYGDANQNEVLEQAGIAGATSLILSASGSSGATEAIRAAREQNPRIHVVARADFLHETASLRQAGADEVFSGEGEVALAMTDSILRNLGATPDQLDEARERIRESLLEAQPPANALPHRDPDPT